MERRHEPTLERTLVERYLAAYNAFDIDAMLAQLAPAVRFEHHADGFLTVATDGIEAFRTLAERSLQLFVEREQRIVSWEQARVAAGSTACAHIAWRGKLAANVADGPDAGEVLTLRGRTDFAFDGERIVQIVDRS